MVNSICFLREWEFSTHFERHFVNTHYTTQNLIIILPGLDQRKILAPDDINIALSLKVKVLKYEKKS